MLLSKRVLHNPEEPLRPPGGFPRTGGLSSGGLSGLAGLSTAPTTAPDVVADAVLKRTTRPGSGRPSRPGSGRHASGGTTEGRGHDGRSGAIGPPGGGGVSAPREAGGTPTAWAGAAAAARRGPGTASGAGGHPPQSTSATTLTKLFAAERERLLSGSDQEVAEQKCEDVFRSWVCSESSISSKNPNPISEVGLGFLDEHEVEEGGDLIDITLAKADQEYPDLAEKHLPGCGGRSFGAAGRPQSDDVANANMKNPSFPPKGPPIAGGLPSSQPAALSSFTRPPRVPSTPNHAAPHVSAAPPCSKPAAPAPPGHDSPSPKTSSHGSIPGTLSFAPAGKTPSSSVGLGGGASSSKIAQTSRSRGAAKEDDSLVTSMARRLKLLEQQVKVQSKDIKKLESAKRSLENEVRLKDRFLEEVDSVVAGGGGEHAVAGGHAVGESVADKRLVDLDEVLEERDALAAELRAVKRFLGDYGLTWVGEEDNFNSGDSSTNNSGRELAQRRERNEGAAPEAPTPGSSGASSSGPSGKRRSSVRTLHDDVAPESDRRSAAPDAYNGNSLVAERRRSSLHEASPRRTNDPPLRKTDNRPSERTAAPPRELFLDLPTLEARLLQLSETAEREAQIIRTQGKVHTFATDQCVSITLFQDGLKVGRFYFYEVSGRLLNMLCDTVWERGTRAGQGRVCPSGEGGIWQRVGGEGAT